MKGTILQRYGIEYLDRLGAEIEQDISKSVFHQAMKQAGGYLQNWNPSPDQKPN